MPPAKKKKKKPNVTRKNAQVTRRAPIKRSAMISGVTTRSQKRRLNSSSAAKQDVLSDQMLTRADISKAEEKAELMSRSQSHSSTSMPTEDTQDNLVLGSRLADNSVDPSLGKLESSVLCITQCVYIPSGYSL